MSPEAQRERAEFATDWMLNKVNATDAQRSQIKAIVAAALQDLTPARDEHRQHREAFLAALTQPNVDRATLEELRRAELQLARSASERIVTALADICRRAHARAARRTGEDGRALPASEGLRRSVQAARARDSPPSARRQLPVGPGGQCAVSALP